jgi:hypothetical protein
LLDEALATYKLSLASIVIPYGKAPTLANNVDVQSGAIFDTLLDQLLATYKLPAVSNTRPHGSVPTLANIDDTQAGVIFDILSQR